MPKETHKFKKGEKLHLDEIYSIRGLAGGEWWDRVDPDDDTSDDLVITQSIEIKIVWESIEIRIAWKSIEIKIAWETK